MEAQVDVVGVDRGGVEIRNGGLHGDARHPAVLVGADEVLEAGIRLLQTLRSVLGDRLAQLRGGVPDIEDSAVVGDRGNSTRDR